MRHILNYLSSSRGVGHSTLLKEGTTKYSNKFFLVGGDSRHTQRLKNEVMNPNAIVISIHDKQKIRGMDIPMVFDNYSIILMLDDYERQLSLAHEQNEGDYKRHMERERELRLEHYFTLK